MTDSRFGVVAIWQTTEARCDRGPVEKQLCLGYFIWKQRVSDGYSAYMGADVRACAPKDQALAHRGFPSKSNAELSWYPR